ncbi:MAG TPA: plasmid stabilization system protein [Cyanobacteria bacterium UBA12227]|nr:plasmid stabilization system protein [Cyanobacteria bacterium UBA12227]HAX88499.1 plasmid stabilization system protein [Cyanobacteria bacterium UBA11370]HBY77276.1 plasmid stabilization system protein [Cyanobacteria bacterium UBA11148]
MRTLVWDSSFRRAFKRVVRKNPQLETKIFEVLGLQIADPFTPALKAHQLKFYSLILFLYFNLTF